MDSLIAITQSTAADSVKARAHLLIAYRNVMVDSAKAQQNLDAGRRLGAKFPFVLALAQFYEGVVRYGNSDIKGSETAFMRADSLLGAFDTKEAYSFRAQAWHNYGILQQVQDNEEGFADLILNKSIPFAQKAGDSAYMGKNYLDLAIIFKNTAQYDKAAAYLQQGIDLLRSHGEVKNLINAYNTAAENFILADRPAPAKVMLDSAEARLKASPNKNLQVDFYTAQGMYLNITGQYAASLEALNSGIALARELGLAYEEQRQMLQQYYTYANMKDYRNGRRVLEALMARPEMMALLTNRLEVFKGMAITNAGLGNMQAAYDWQLRYSNLSDSVHASKLKNDIHALEIKYGNAENQKKIAALKLENERAALAARNSRLIQWLLGSAAVFIAVVAFLLYRNFRNSKQLAAQQLKEMEQQQQIRFSQAMLQGEERERRRVAGDLHDGLGGMLSGVKMNIESMNAINGADLHKVVNQLDNSITELRRIARNMMPEALLKFGLETALQDLSESFMSEQVRISFQALNLQTNIPQPKQVTIYRIVQELLTNAIRHAQATEILLQCSQDGHTLLITLEDNGKGFDTSKMDAVKGIGLSNVQSRVAYLQGKMDISSTLDEGTVINIEVNVA